MRELLHDAPGHARRQERVSVGDGGDRSAEFGGFDLFGEEAAGSGAQGGEDVFVGVEGGEDDDATAQSGRVRDDAACGGDPIGAVRRPG
ncbi:hypothetical protein [Nonomuraea antri]|uniref:hypothetical protein n=1 Tax=Nonomuraea antri TaxID=2730852 RepID=UPI001F3EC6A5|nr:hypothetical protein [Nonomuraea antri]